MSVPAGADIEHVSDTALWVANYRTLESRRSDALFHDPLAEILAGERGRRIARRLQNETVLAWAIALRTRIMDELIVAAIAQGVNFVLNLGAGLDARPYRMDLPASMDWVEVDYPHMVEFKAFHHQATRADAPSHGRRGPAFASGLSRMALNEGFF